MKEKIKNALKTEYAKMGLGDKAFDGVASFLVKTINQDEEIDGVIKSEDTKGLLKAFQGESDSLRNRAAQLEKDFNAYKEKHPDSDPKPNPNPNPNPDVEPEWAKKLREQQEAIAARFAKEDQEKALKAARLTVESKLKSEGCTNAGILNLTLKGFNLDENETMEAAVARLKGEYNASYKETFGDGPMPGVGTPAFGDTKTAVSHKNDFLREQGLLPQKDN